MFPWGENLHTIIRRIPARRATEFYSVHPALPFRKTINKGIRHRWKQTTDLARIEVYQKALTGLEHANMHGRIGEARAEILQTRFGTGAAPKILNTTQQWEVCRVGSANEHSALLHCLWAADCPSEELTTPP